MAIKAFLAFSSFCDHFSSIVHTSLFTNKILPYTNGPIIVKIGMQHLAKKGTDSMCVCVCVCVFVCVCTGMSACMHVCVWLMFNGRVNHTALLLKLYFIAATPGNESPYHQTLVILKGNGHSQ